MCGRALQRVVDWRRRFGVLSSVDGAVGGTRVDASQVDVGVDGSEDEAEDPEN